MLSWQEGLKLHIYERFKVETEKEFRRRRCGMIDNETTSKTFNNRNLSTPYAKLLKAKGDYIQIQISVQCKTRKH